MALKNVQYVYAQNLSEQQRTELNINIQTGLIAVETRASELKRTSKDLKSGIVDYIQSLDKEHKL